jgi:hypothetical protein
MSSWSAALPEPPAGSGGADGGLDEGGTFDGGGTPEGDGALSTAGAWAADAWS